MTELKQRAGDQPLPVPNGQLDVQSMVIADITARRKVGIERYGTALQPHNGRDGLRDLYEELLDGAMYARQLIAERNVEPAVRELLRALTGVFEGWAEADAEERRGLWDGLREAADRVRAAMDDPVEATTGDT